MAQYEWKKLKTMQENTGMVQYLNMPKDNMQSKNYNPGIVE